MVAIGCSPTRAAQRSPSAGRIYGRPRLCKDLLSGFDNTFGCSHLFGLFDVTHPAPRTLMEYPPTSSQSRRANSEFDAPNGLLWSR